MLLIRERSFIESMVKMDNITSTREREKEVYFFSFALVKQVKLHILHPHHYVTVEQALRVYTTLHWTETNRIRYVRKTASSFMTMSLWLCQDDHIINLIFHRSRSRSKSAIAVRSSFTCGCGLDGGQAHRKLLSLLHNSVL